MHGQDARTRKSPAKFTIVVALVFLCVACVRAENWPRFRGPNGQGLSEDKSIPVKWSAQEYAWKIELPGGGHSSPVVWGDKVFVTAADTRTLSGVILCVNASDGKELWRRRYDLSKIPLNSLNSYASATPALDDEHAYAMWPGVEETRLTAMTHDGKEAWTARLPGSRTRHGVGSSPIVCGDVVILSHEQDKGSGDVTSVCFAFDCRTGQIRWRRERPETINASYSTPCVRTDERGRAQLVLTSNLHGVAGADLGTGEILWDTPGALPARTVSSPVLAGGMIVANCGEGGRGIRMAVVKPPGGDTGSAATEVYAIDGPTISYVPTPIVYDGLLYLFLDQGKVSCLRAGTGETLWSEKPAGRYFGSPVCVDGKLYCITADGDVVVLRAGTTYELLAANPLGEKSHATPAVAGGQMHLRTFSHLICVGGGQ
ncbi:MAG: PQQ-binding-like beta-propeller repeat protein [Phycisphaerales bacterium]